MHTSNTCKRRRVVLVPVPFPVLCAMGFKGFDGGSELVSLYLQLSLSPSGLLHGLSMVLSCVWCLWGNVVLCLESRQQKSEKAKEAAASQLLTCQVRCAPIPGPP